MANKLASYKFHYEAMYNSAKERILNEVSEDDKGLDYSFPYIYIYDNCEKVALVRQICRAYGAHNN